MPEKLTLSAYLAQRGKKAKALTRIEAEVFGIPFPLLAGWPRRHGAMEITPEMLDHVAERAAVDATSTERALKRGGRRAAAAQGKPIACTAVKPVAAASALFPGFVLRPARRYRSRKPAPWT